MKGLISIRPAAHNAEVAFQEWTDQAPTTLGLHNGSVRKESLGDEPTPPQIQVPSSILSPMPFVWSLFWLPRVPAHCHLICVVWTPSASLQPDVSCQVSLPLETTLTHLYLHLFRTLLCRNHLTLRKARNHVGLVTMRTRAPWGHRPSGQPFCDTPNATGVQRVSGVSITWWLTEHAWSRRIISLGRLEQRAPFPRACPAKSSWRSRRGWMRFQFHWPSVPALCASPPGAHRTISTSDLHSGLYQLPAKQQNPTTEASSGQTGVHPLLSAFSSSSHVFI